MFIIKQGDRLPIITAELEELDGSAVDLSGCTVQIRWQLADGTGAVTTQSATITNASTGAVEYAWGASDTATAGTYNLEWVVTNSGTGKVRTFPAEDYNTFIISRKLQ